VTTGAAVAAAAARALGTPVTGARPVAGGDLNAAFALELADGRRAFAKTAPDAAPGGYAAEAAGLAWLAQPQALAVPEVLAVADDPGEDPRLLVLAWVQERPAGPGFAEALGRGLAAVHDAGAPAHGALPPTTDGAVLRLGPLELPSAPAGDWPSCYAEQRVAPLLRAAQDRGALPDGCAARVEAVLARLPALAGPPEPPARLHGDLWGGNVLAAGDGARPVLIDPAAHGGHREVDLAMLALFGAPGGVERVVTAYGEVHPLADGHAERVALWQLFPLLVHAVLFGGGYGAAVDRAARAYA
jgi:fructosamine-3-kinase